MAVNHEVTSSNLVGRARPFAFRGCETPRLRGSQRSGGHLGGFRSAGYVGPPRRRAGADLPSVDLLRVVSVKRLSWAGLLYWLPDVTVPNLVSMPKLGALP